MAFERCVQNRQERLHMASAAKSSQADLTEAALLTWSGKPQLVDIGLNLADSAFDKVLA